MIPSSTEVITDSMSERELQRIARSEMVVALDTYLKRKRVESLAVEQNASSTQSTELAKEPIKSNSECSCLKEPLRTYDEAFSSVGDHCLHSN